MEQNLNDKPLSNMQIARYIESLRKEMNFDDEVYGLVKSDLEDGLTQEQTEKYLDKNFNIGQMRVLSEGLHKGIPEELFNILHNNKLSGNQMKVSLEFYEKGVPVETIQEAVARGEKPVVRRSSGTAFKGCGAVYAGLRVCERTDCTDGNGSGENQLSGGKIRCP